MRVWWAGRWHHLGRADEPVKWKAELNRLLAVWAIDPGAASGKPADYLVSELCSEYLESRDSPAPGRERERAVDAVELLLDLFPETAVAEFGPLDLFLQHSEILLGYEAGHFPFYQFARIKPADAFLRFATSRVPIA